MCKRKWQETIKQIKLIGDIRVVNLRGPIPLAPSRNMSAVVPRSVAPTVGIRALASMAGEGRHLYRGD